MRRFLLYFLTLGLLTGNNQIPDFQKGDVIGFWGDSITHAEYSEVNYTHVLYNYYVTHMPEEEIELRNLGVGGAQLRHGLELYEKDPMSKGLDKAVLEYGINDLKKYFYETPESYADGAEAREDNLEEYQGNLSAFLEKLQEDGVEKADVSIATLPIPYDASTIGETGALKGPQYRTPEGFERMSETARKYAEQQGIGLIEFHKPLLELTESLGGEDPVGKLLCEDRMHLNTSGQIYLSYLFLEQQGVLKDVSKVEIKEGRIHSEDAEVSHLRQGEGYLYYDYRADRLPMGISEEYREADKDLNILDKLNREIIQVQGLKEDAVYDIYITGKQIGSYSGREFNEGVNIANLEGNPAQQWAAAIEGMNRGRRVAELAYRKKVQDFTDCGSGAVTEAEILEAFEAWHKEDQAYRQDMYQLARQEIEITERIAIVQQGAAAPEDAFAAPGKSYKRMAAAGFAAAAVMGGCLFCVWRRRRRKMGSTQS